MDKIKSVYIGACSALTALGNLEETLEAMTESLSGLRYEERYGMHVGAIPPERLREESMEESTCFDSLVISETRKVLELSRLEASDPDLLVILSTTKGNVSLLSETLQPVDERAWLYRSAELLRADLGLKYQPIVLSNACISGVSALIVGRELILSGKYRHVLVVGCDLLSEFVTAGFASFKSISTQPCRPYDLDRDGLNLGEACAAMLLTEDVAKARRPLVRIAGGAVTNDANHISGPSRTGDGLFYAVDQALKEAGLSASDIGFVNTHGTATVYNDEMESKAIHWAGLDQVPLNSLKGYLGHTLGASGVVEAMICIEELKKHQIFPTLGFSHPGTPCVVSVSSETQTFVRQNCVKTASGFGGCNAAVVFSMEEGKNTASISDRPITVSAAYTLPQSELPFGEFIRSEFKRLGESNLKFYKMSDLCKAAYVAAAHLLEGQVLSDEMVSRRTAIILSNRSSSLEADVRHQEVLNEHHPEGASPAVFVYTLPNVATGELCIKHKIRGNNTFFIEASDSGLSEEYARMLIQMNKADQAICGWCELFDGKWNVKLKLLKA